MNRTVRVVSGWMAVASLGLSLGGCVVQSGEFDEEGVESGGEEAIDESGEPVTCSPKLTYFPVRGKHNTGYDSTAGNSSLWSCNSAYSNSDFIAGDHLGIDIWAAEGTPVVAPVSGTLITAGYLSSHAGYVVKVRDACGWDYYSGHLKGIAPGIVKNNYVKAGTVVGYVGKSGTSSNGVVHLHFSLFPAGSYSAGINPWQYLKAVESNVCTLPLGGGTAPVPDAYAPFGMFDWLGPKGGGRLGLYGWAMDPDTKTKAIPVHIYVWGSDGVKRGPYVRTANQYRPDVGAAYPGYGNYHGYSTELGTFPKGSTKVEVFAIDSSGKANDYKSLGAKWVSVY